MSAAEPLVPVFIFIGLAGIFWGLGRLLMRAFSPDFGEDSFPLTFAVQSALGMAVFGQAVFLLGWRGDHYTRPILAGALLCAAATAAIPLLRRREFPRPPRTPSGLSGFESVALLIAAVCLVRWFLSLMGFVPGSDVFSHHYAHAKDLIRLQHFGHIPRLPDGQDHISNYNPSLMHMVYMMGMVLYDERVANLLHWLTQVQLVLLLYGIGSVFSGRSAGLMVLGIYLGLGLHGNFPLDVQDYTFLAVLMMTSVYGILRYQKKGAPGDLALAAVAAGLMLSVKYYGLILMVPLLGGVWVVSPGAARKTRDFLLFGLVALAVFSPWLIYNLVHFRNPLFPYFTGTTFIKLMETTYALQVLGSFVAPTDSGVMLPRLFYYLSLFIPFDPGFLTAGLSPIFLLGVPCSLYGWSRTRGFHRTPQGLLFILYLSSMILIEALAGWTTFYKWALFPACAYAVSLSLQASAWSPGDRRKAWAAVVFVAVFNYAFNVRGSIDSYAPVFQRSQRWTPVARYLNENLESGAVVANVDFLTNFYLRPDIVSYAGSGGGDDDWAVEERFLREKRVEYYLDDAAGDERMKTIFVGIFRRFSQLHPDDSAGQAYLGRTMERVESRIADKNGFIAKNARVIREFAPGVTLYRLAGDVSGKGAN